MKKFTNELAMHADWLLFILILLAMIMIAYVGIRHILKKRRERNCQDKATDLLYSFLAENSLQAILIVRGADAMTLFVSDNVGRMFGVEKEDICVDVFSLSRCMDPEEDGKLEKLYQSWDRTQPLFTEFSFKNNKTEKSGTASMWVQYSKKNDVYTIVMEDISVRKEGENALRKELTKVKAENNAKTEFLSEMSHEIRTPINGILGLLELAKMDITNEKTVKEYIDKTQNLSHFLLHLINDILDLTRIESGKIELLQESFDLIAMAQKIRSMFIKTIGEKNLHFELRMEGFDIRRVVGDEMRLSQVIINFLSNAVKFTEPGGSVILTFRQMEKIDNHLRLMIQVRDTGKGIEPEFLTHIFRPFEQENSMIAKKYGGSGLGMSIADNIVRLMGGQIVIDSEVGKGSDFTVFLSLPVAQEEIRQVEESKLAISSDGVREYPEKEFIWYLKGARVLLAEDNDINAKITMAILEKAGVKTDRVITGREAVETFHRSEEGTYDVILMDIQMPEMDGWEATQRIRKMKRKDAQLIPIYALSANSYVEDQRHSTEVGMNEHIAKPIDFNKLKEKMGMAIRDSKNEWNSTRKTEIENI